jgi:hypothetical protein
MSYLDVPRLHVAGRFFTDPATVNNDPRNYDPANTRPAPWQEPYGRNWFRLVQCAVVSALDGAGGDAGGDAVIGAPVASTDTPSPAKLVDLDVYQQGVSTIYGLQLAIGVTPTLTLTGTVDPPSLNSVHFDAVLPERGWESADEYGWGSRGGDANACGWFRTLLRVPAAAWPAVSGSAVVDQLRAACETDAAGNLLVSLRMVLDGYINNPEAAAWDEVSKPDPNIMYRRLGRFVAALGPGRLVEGVQAPGPRWLEPRPTPQPPPDSYPLDWWIPAFYGAPFQVDAARSRLVLDLGNAIARNSVGGPFVDLGTLTAVIGGSCAWLRVGDVPLGAGYENVGGIYEVPLTADQLAGLAADPLHLITSRTDIGEDTSVLREADDGVFLAADTRVVRLAGDPADPASRAATTLRVTRFGQPLPDYALDVAVVSVHGGTPGATVPPYNPGNTAQADGALTASATATDGDGWATLSLAVVRDPGARTSELDGQLYFLWPYPAGGTPPTAGQQEATLSVLAWSASPVLAQPAWSDIAAIMTPYVKLYPFMRGKIDLTDQHSFTVFMDNPPWCPFYTSDPNYNVQGISRGAIAYFMTLPVTDPRFMPVSRDLSPARLQTVLNYIRNALAESGR